MQARHVLKTISVFQDEKNQVMTTNVWFDQEWNDALLRWNPSDFGGVKAIRVPCDRIWLPDMVLYNNADDYTTEYMRSLALVKHNGDVFWPPPTKFRSTCPVNVAFFPFDDQTCMIKLGSWLHDGFSDTHEIIKELRKLYRMEQCGQEEN
eukprot:snap_masked-scaffold508_size152036-processed-gene-0.11 protein:Tk11409 transcript:snap_masked-scaffold508_size152036-processed-gene-0.11-mRNA-1 annotation:"hypothetical protein DAPPUDRAFT_39496"